MVTDQAALRPSVRLPLIIHLMSVCCGKIILLVTLVQIYGDLSEIPYEKVAQIEPQVQQTSQYVEYSFRIENLPIHLEFSWI
jgi:hypothetical protein